MSLVIVINDSEIAAGTRGSSLGSRAIEIEALKKNDDVFRRHPIHVVGHQNNALYDRNKHPFAKHIDAFSKVFDSAASIVNGVVQSGHFPLVISADHGNAAATIAGLKTANPAVRIGVIWIDAHADMHSPYTTPSGNIHGMPLAICMNEDNLDSQQNDPAAETVQIWDQLKSYGGVAPKVNAEDIIFFGVRDTEEPEVKLMQEKGVKNYTVSEVARRGAQVCVDEALDQLDECDVIYLSFDVDSMDPEVVSKGTGTPVRKGFTPETALEIMQHFIASGKIGCLEIVEVNPLLDDKGNEMARTTYLIMKELLKSLKKVIPA